MSHLKVCSILIGATILSSSGCARDELPVSFNADVQPLLAQHCLRCHQPGAEGYEKSGFGVENYSAVMKGTRFGPVVVPGDSFSSNLIVLVEGRADPSIEMPHEGRKLRDEELETLKTWIDEGALDN